MKDPMLTELYRRAFKTKKEAEIVGQDEATDRKRQVAIAKNKLLSELIDIRTDQLRHSGRTT